jgi:predicted metal-dependent hydrolase
VTLHPVLSPDERRRLIREGIEQFHRGEFFAAHETWEEVWRSTTPEPRTLFQGLIQVAAALHQLLDLHRHEGPRRTLAKARRNLEPYAPVALGLDIGQLLDSVGLWQAWLEGREGEPPRRPTLMVIDAEALR